MKSSTVCGFEGVGQNLLKTLAWAGGGVVPLPECPGRDAGDELLVVWLPMVTPGGGPAVGIAPREVHLAQSWQLADDSSIVRSV
jgi:hypothetical protein